MARPAELRAERWRLIVGELSRMAGLAEQLVEDHRSDEAGRCRGCSREQAGSATWPCTLYWLASEAVRVKR